MIETITNTINEMDLNETTVYNLSRFFKDVNDFLKGSNDTLIFIYYDINNELNSNILNDIITVVDVETFKLNFIEWIEMFSDNNEILTDLLDLMKENNLI